MPCAWQVTTRDIGQTIRRPVSVAGPGLQDGPHCGAWKRKFRNFLCCLAPMDNDHYIRADCDSRARIAMVNSQELSPTYSRTNPILPPLAHGLCGKKSLVLDLDETLVHSSFKPVPNADYIIPVSIEGSIVNVYVLKRPWYDKFMAEIAPHFEVSPLSPTHHKSPSRRIQRYSLRDV